MVDVDVTGVILGVLVVYFVLVCCCVVVGPRVMCRSVTVKEAQWPDVEEAPCLNLFGWGIGGPFTARWICSVADELA